MARKRNTRNLLSTLWSNSMYCMYCAKPESVYNWTNTMKVLQKLHELPHKLMLRTKKKKGSF